MKTSCLILCLYILASFIGFVQKPADTIPNFTFYKLDKTPFTKKDLPEGKLIFFIFFDVTCDHCQETIKALNNHINEFDDIGVYLVTLDNQVMIKRFFNEYGKNLINQKNVMILQDLRNLFITNFGPRKYPSIFLYSPSKKLILYSDEDTNLENFLHLISNCKGLMNE